MSKLFNDVYPTLKDKGKYYYVVQILRYENPVASIDYLPLKTVVLKVDPTTKVNPLFTNPDASLYVFSKNGDSFYISGQRCRMFDTIIDAEAYCASVGADTYYSKEAFDGGNR